MKETVRLHYGRLPHNRKGSANSLEGKSSENQQLRTALQWLAKNSLWSSDQVLSSLFNGSISADTLRAEGMEGKLSLRILQKSEFCLPSRMSDAKRLNRWQQR
jgi:hypothetical protein